MKNLIIKILCGVLFTTFVNAQTATDLINKVSIDDLVRTVNEFTGEQTTVVNGVTQTIINRQQNDNDLAADYLVERLNNMNNLTVSMQQFDSNGRNVIATQLGKTNPNDIYIICAHYDSVDDYCADDNASGVAATLEIARILSTQCLNNTMVYAFWDEEENGLNGSEYYANLARTNNANILGVINIDMMAFDNDNDMSFDIDVRNYANSLTVKDDLISALNTYNLNLNVNVVNPGTTASDHSSFWFKNYSAVLLGEAWSENDQNSEYHSAADRISLFNLPYYHEMTKLLMAYAVTKGGLISVDNTVTETIVNLTANQTAASYQWYNCTANTMILGATNQIFQPTENGTYAVEITSESCVEFSDCIVFDTLGLALFSEEEIKVFPNPVSTLLKIYKTFSTPIKYRLFDVSGRIISEDIWASDNNTLNVQYLTSGIYFLKLSTDRQSQTYKVIKE